MEIFIKASQLLLSLSILVVLHELGHFIPAKLFKTRVEKFYLFFDWKFSLFKIKKGETEYGIGWLPLGGYVKIAGMIDESMDKEQMKEEPKPWEFRSKPAWQRLIIMVGGVLVNVILAMFIYAMILFTWGKEYLPVQNATYGIYADSVALDAGFNQGDIILAIDGTPIGSQETFGDVTHKLILENAKEITVMREGSEHQFTLPENFVATVLESRTRSLLMPAIPFIIDSMMPGMPAVSAGFMNGDRIVSINGEQRPFIFDVIPTINKNKGNDITVGVIRNGREEEIPVKVSDEGVIGIYPVTEKGLFDIERRTYTFFESIPAGINEAITILSGYVQQFKLIFTKAGAKQIGGFGTIGSLFPPVWDWQVFWGMTAFLSIILAFMNILPIPALDGGHVTFLLYEMITGRKPSENFLEKAQMIGFIILITLLVYANGMDIIRGFSD
jgi:regulator of sigma E protease